MRVRIQLLAPEHCWSIPTGSCLTTRLTALISLRATTTCLKNWLGSQSFNKNEDLVEGAKRDSAHRQQISLTQAYKNLFPVMISVSVPAVTTLRSSLSMYVLFLFFIACFVSWSPEVTFRIALICTYIYYIYRYIHTH
jgi:hypothetical protein